MREVADVHRELFREHAARYGENVRLKIERCLAVTDDELDEGLRAREAYRERCLERVEGVDLLLTPTTPFVAPPADADELTIPGRCDPLHVPIQRARMAGAGAALGIGGRWAFRVPRPARGATGDDALVLAVGEQLERAASRRTGHG